MTIAKLGKIDLQFACTPEEEEIIRANIQAVYECKTEEEMKELLNTTTRNTLIAMHMAENWGRYSSKLFERIRDYKGGYLEQQKKATLIAHFIFGAMEAKRLRAFKAEQKEKIAEFYAKKDAEFQQLLADVRAGKKLSYHFYLREELMQIAEAGKVEIPANIGVEKILQRIIDAGIMEARVSQVLQAEEPKTVEKPAEQAKECGKAIVALKGNAKAQAAKLEEYGEEFLDSMLYVFYKPMKVKTESEIRKWMCRDILRCARDKEYAVSKRESVRCTINNLTYHLSWWNEADRKEEELKIEHLKGWYEFLGEYTGKEEEAMTQTHAVEAIRTAYTVETISGALLKSGKVKDMCAAFEETVGEKYYGKTVAIKKDELALNMAFRIMHSRENEAFKALSLAEKCKRLSEINPFDAPRYVHQCEMEELKEIADMLGVESDYDGENIIQAKMSYGDAIVKGLILNANNLKHSTETSQPEALYEDDVYADDGGDNSAQEQDILEAHIPEAHESEEIPATVIDVSAGVENYECGKLTAEELAEILDRAPAEVLREYILKVIVKDPPEVIKIPA